MANKRMINTTVIDSDVFLDMSVDARLLYYDLIMVADDDGFVASPKKVIKSTQVSPDALSELVSSGYVYHIEGVVIIKHWKLHNSIPKDRYTPTLCKEIYSQFELTNNIYEIKTEHPEEPIAEAVEEAKPVEEPEEKPKTKKFIPPTVEEVRRYAQERKSNISPDKFIDYYSSNGWKVGKNSMKDWKAAFRNWEKNGYSSSASALPNKQYTSDYYRELSERGENPF